MGWTFFVLGAEASLEPEVQDLRFAPVGAEQTSPGCLAPHLPLAIEIVGNQQKCCGCPGERITDQNGGYTMMDWCHD